MICTAENYGQERDSPKPQMMALHLERIGMKTSVTLTVIVCHNSYVF